MTKKGVNDELVSLLKELKGKVDSLEIELRQIKEENKTLKEELSNTPSQPFSMNNKSVTPHEGYSREESLSAIDKMLPYLREMAKRSGQID